LALRRTVQQIWVREHAKQVAVGHQMEKAGVVGTRPEAAVHRWRNGAPMRVLESMARLGWSMHEVAYLAHRLRSTLDAAADYRRRFK
jgi:hypothetical protein